MFDFVACFVEGVKFNFVTSVYAHSTLSKVPSTLSTVDKVEFDFVDSVYWA